MMIFEWNPVTQTRVMLSIFIKEIVLAGPELYFSERAVNTI